MAEQISTIIDESKLVGGEIINEQIIESKKEEVNKNKDEQIISETIIDESKLVGGEEIKPTKITSTTNNLIDESKLLGGENAITGELNTEPTNFERLEYGWDRETMVLGNVFRIGKAKVQDLFDSDKSFKDYIIKNEAKRIENLYKEHWKFRGREDDGGGVATIGSVASMILDPY